MGPVNPSFPSFSIQDIVTYFIEREANDKEANKDYKNVNNKAFGLFKHGHVQKIEFAKDVDKTHVKC